METKTPTEIKMRNCKNCSTQAATDSDLCSLCQVVERNKVKRRIDEPLSERISSKFRAAFER